MRKLTLDQWEKKYVIAPLERYDPKNNMFNRWSWQPEMRASVKDWRFSGEITSKPGYSLRDLALRRSSGGSSPAPRREATIAAERPGSTPSTNTATLNPSEEETSYFSNPQMVTRDIKKIAMHFGASLVGICKVENRWVYSHTYHGEGPMGAPGDTPVVIGESKPHEIPNEFQYAVVMAFAEDYSLLKYHPTWIAQSATSLGYAEMAITNARLSAFIRNLGYKAIESGNDVAMSIPMAMQAGLGEIGRNGLLITARFGPRIRLSKVLTNLPLIADSPIEFGVTEYCEACKKCAVMCPSQSLLYGERTTEPNSVSNVGGSLKWPINAETCRRYWGQVNRPCTTCISCCSYNKPDTWPHKTVRWFTDHVRWADPLYIKMDNLLGYGAQKNADNFWEEWQPNQH